MDQESMRLATAPLRFGDRFNMASENGCNALRMCLLHVYRMFPERIFPQIRRVLLGLGLLLNNCALVFMIQSAGIV